MNILQAKNEIKNTVKAYLSKNSFGEYAIESKNQRPLLLIGPPGIGKTQIMEQISKECQIGLVSYTITHHTRQSAVGLPFIQEKVFDGKNYSITEYTMSEIIASVYSKMEDTGLKEGILFIDEINCVSETLAPTMLQFLQNKTFGNQKVPAGWIIVAAGNQSGSNSLYKCGNGLLCVEGICDFKSYSSNDSKLFRIKTEPFLYGFNKCRWYGICDGARLGRLIAFIIYL